MRGDSAEKEESITKKKVSALFGKSMICEPNFWSFVMANNTDSSIKGVEANFHIMQADKTYKTVKGRIIQTISDANKVWLYLVSSNTALNIRNPKKDELSM